MIITSHDVSPSLRQLRIVGREDQTIMNRVQPCPTCGMKDLQNPKWMYFKAGLFLLIGVTSGASIIAANTRIQTIILLALVIWSFCRVYYFAFYVIEKY